ncbi:intermembrane lipid transfer protein VPS13B-like [Oncorhynchus keta]|uniref:intermembrane lipid transfer protein VPS13B-like n=1 Tax=Oncorhynchus keta TaxID=8018 RepID=UPI00227BA1F9|nr:intermembrane lipid transfer protein VPS13B-like [Oncorhynchus keta]
MLWRYPESRVLTFVRITPVPFNTTEDPEISTADLGDRLKVPCSLEYWDELQHAFVPYREFSLSESSACELTLPSLTLTNEQKDLVTSDLWRIVLNNNPDGGDEQSSDSESGSQQGSSGSQLLPCDQLVSPRRWQLVPVSTPASPLVRALPGRVSHPGTDTAAPLPPPGAAGHSAVTSTPPLPAGQEVAPGARVPGHRGTGAAAVPPPVERRR